MATVSDRTDAAPDTAAPDRLGASSVRRGRSHAETIDELYQRHGRRIQDFCAYRLGNREEAEDAAQLTFLNAYRGLRRGTTVELEAAWLYRIAENVCSNSRRSSLRRGRIETPVDPVDVDRIPGPPQGRPEELIWLEHALGSMPEQQRRAILLREWQGLSYKEISAELGLSQAAVETLLFRARRSLAERLEEAPPTGRSRLRSLTDVGSIGSAIHGFLFSGGLKTAATLATVAAATVVAGSPDLRHRIADVVQAIPLPFVHSNGAPDAPEPSPRAPTDAGGLAPGRTGSLRLPELAASTALPASSSNASSTPAAGAPGDSAGLRRPVEGSAGPIAPGVAALTVPPGASGARSDQPEQQQAEVPVALARETSSSAAQETPAPAAGAPLTPPSPPQQEAGPPPTGGGGHSAPGQTGAPPPGLAKKGDLWPGRSAQGQSAGDHAKNAKGAAKHGATLPGRPEPKNTSAPDRDEHGPAGNGPDGAASNGNGSNGEGAGARGPNGKEASGPGEGGPGPAAQASAGGQGSAGQGSAGQGSTGQGSAGQGSTAQGSAGQGSTGQGSTGQGSAGAAPGGGQASGGQAPGEHGPAAPGPAGQGGNGHEGPGGPGPAGEGPGPGGDGPGPGGGGGGGSGGPGPGGQNGPTGGGSGPGPGGGPGPDGTVNGGIL